MPRNNGTYFWIFTYDQYFIQADECIDCGICASVCPADAIYEEDELPEPWRHYAEINAAFYKKLL